jgi:hypothetical protein
MHHNGPVVPSRALRRVVLFALAALIVLSALPATGFAKSHKKKAPKPKVTLSISTVAADQVLAAKKVKVKVKSSVAGTVSLKLALRTGKKSATLASTKKVRLKKKNKTTTVSITLSKAGRTALATCSASTVRLSASIKVKGRKGTATKSAKFATGLHCHVKPPTPIISKCDPDDSAQCLLPFPNNYNTVPDPKTATKLRVNLPLSGMPQNTVKSFSGKVSHTAIDPTQWNKNDGFSPGSSLLTKIPGLETAAALTNSKLPPVDDIGTYADADSGVVVIDTSTGQRWPVWAEVDSNADTDAHRLLIIRPAKNFLEGHRYVVGLRNLKNAANQPIAPSAAFKTFRDNLPSTDATITARRPAMESIFKTLTTAGVARSSLNLAWDFTVASENSLTSRALQIRNDAFHQLGDDNLADEVVPPTSHSPAFTVNSVCLPHNTGGGCPTDDVDRSNKTDFVNNIARQIKGTVTVPCYLDKACASGGQFTYGADGKIQQHGTYQARFVCNIPTTANAGNTATSALYGHGLFGDYDEAGEAADVWKLGHDHNIIVCGADWIGMAEEDQAPTALNALNDLSKFEPLVDRLQQGYLDFNFIARALHTTAAQGGFASNVNFQDGGQPLIDTSHVSYYGNSQGGIAGGALTALAPDITRSVLYVGAMNYSTLLPRSVDFDDFKPFIFGQYAGGGYSDSEIHPLLLALMQMLWDRGDPDGYAQHMTTDPLLDTPVHHVLMEISLGDHQVSNIAALVEARTAGLHLRTNQTLAPQRLVGHENLLWGVPTVESGALPTTQDGINIWDIGPLRPKPGGQPGEQTGVPLFPMTNTAPADVGQDPHDYTIRNSASLRAQIADWIKPNGQWNEAIRGAIVGDAGDGCGVGNFCKIPDSLWDGTF